MIPVTIVTGFLGSGKSSLIAHTLDSAGERALALVVNDLARESIDATLLAGGDHLAEAPGDRVRVVAGGRGGAEKLLEVLAAIDDLAAADTPPDAILVELSGSSPASGLVYALESRQAVAGLDSVVCVVDALSVGTNWRDPAVRELMTDQLAHADLVILNKFDRAGFWQRRKARKIALKGSNGAQVASAEGARAPFSEVVASGRREGAQNNQRPARQATGSRTNTFVARHLVERLPVHPDRLHELLDAEWPGIFRIKGFLWLATDMDHVYVLDADTSNREVGLEATWRAATADEHSTDSASHPYGDRRQELTIIGSPQGVQTFVRDFRHCLLSRPEVDRGSAAWRSLDDPMTGPLRQQLTLRSGADTQ